MIHTNEQLPASEFTFGIQPTGARLPDATHIGAVHLQVADLRRSIDYYTGLLGLAVLETGDDVAALGVGGLHRPLVVLHEKQGVAPAPRRGRFGLFHFAILLPDRPALGRFARHILDRDVRAGMADHAVSEAFYLTDPDGLGIEVYADRPRDTWQQRGRELVMVTEPLDLGSVMDAAADGEWKGVPAGTVMGHIHLHVGSLADAEAFYHATLGFAKTVWGYPGALFMSAGGYHHHVATNVWSPGPAARADEAQLLEWDLVLPPGEDLDAVARRVGAGGYQVSRGTDAWRAADPWGTRFRLVHASS